MCLVGNKRADIARVIPCKNNFCTKFAHRFHFCGLQKLNTLNLRLFHPPLNPCNHFPTVLIKTNWYTISYKFYGCKTLKNIVLPNSIASIGDYTFRRCYSLTSINIPSSLTSVCDSTFEETLTALNIKTSKCLRFMPQLKSQIIEITFSKDYEETDVTHWDEWTKLEYLTSLSETPPMIGDSFSRFQKWNLRVMVPTSALETYKNTPVWKDFFFLKGGAETTDIENIKQDTSDANITGNHSTYNLNGMKVYNTKPGHIYIRGGKKYVAK